MIALSHRIFHSSEETYCAVCSVLNEVGAKKSLSDYLKIQFYAAIIPFIFSLLGILAVFYLGKTAFDETAGMYAAFFFAINPVDIFVSHKLLTDGILSFFVTISLVCYLMSIKKQKNKYLLFLSGVLCGFSILAKQSAGVTVVAIILYMLIKDRNWLMLVWGGALSYPFLQTLLKGKEELYIFILIAITIFSLFEIRSGTVVSLSQLMINRQALIFLTGVFLVSGFWFIRMYQVYGEFLYSPSASAIRPAAVTDITGWFLHIRSRPLGMISYLTATIYLSPLFAISLVSLKKYFIDLFFMIKHKNADSFFVLSWFIILSYLYMFKGTSELRYIMPAYPFLAVLSGYYFSQIVRKKIFLERSRRKGTLCFVIALFLLLSSSFWSVIIAKETVKSGRMFFDIPF